MKAITLEPISRIEGEINLPGSKSLSNRALLLAALAKGTTTVTNLLDSDDIRHMLNALKALGGNYQLSEDKTCCEVEGLDGAFQVENGLSLFLGNAGTAMRPLTAALCLKGNTEGEVILTGEPRMKERPIKHLVDALLQAGADVRYLENDGYPPLAIRNQGIKGGVVEIDGSISSQFLTALLMAAPLAEGDLDIHIVGDLVSKPYIDITLAMMKDFGVSDFAFFKRQSAGFSRANPARDSAKSRRHTEFRNLRRFKFGRGDQIFPRARICRLAQSRRRSSAFFEFNQNRRKKLRKKSKFRAKF